jgi:hypothetical protein
MLYLALKLVDVPVMSIGIADSSAVILQSTAHRLQSGYFVPPFLSCAPCPSKKNQVHDEFAIG